MNIRALIVDDEEEIVRTAGEVVKSMEHVFDSAGDIKTARQHLETTRYDYLILDMNLPLDPQRLTGRRENGRNFLANIRRMDGLATLPVIVVTGHDGGQSDFILSVIRVGGMEYTQYVQKPIDGDKLDKAIRDALNSRVTGSGTGSSSATMPVTQKPVRQVQPSPFTIGELVFYPNRVELCGVKVLSDSGLGHCRRMLDMLREKKRDRFVRIGGEDLADRIGKAVNEAIGIGTITGCAKTFRSNIKTRLSRDLNLVCEDHDVLIRDEQGYHFNDEKITVRDGTDEGDIGDVPSNVPGDKTAVPGVPANDPGDINDDPANVPEDMDRLNERQIWILEQINKAQNITRARLEAKFGISAKTAKRDLSKLISHDHIEYVRDPFPGFYRRKL